MTAPFNPQAAADQARNAYRNVTAQLGLLALDTAIPEAMGAVAEKTVGETREAYDRSKNALEASIATFERSFDAAGWGAAAFNHKIIDIARGNLNSGVDLANSLAGAKNLAEIVELQAAYWRKQFSALTAQAEEVPALSTKVVADAGEPLKGHTQPRSNFRASPWRQANPAARKATMDYLDYVAHAQAALDAQD